MTVSGSISVILATCRCPDGASELRAITKKSNAQLHVKILKLDVTDYDSLDQFVKDVDVSIKTCCSSRYFNYAQLVTQSTVVASGWRERSGSLSQQRRGLPGPHQAIHSETQPGQ